MVRSGRAQVLVLHVELTPAADEGALEIRGAPADALQRVGDRHQLARDGFGGVDGACAEECATEDPTAFDPSCAAG